MEGAKFYTGKNVAMGEVVDFAISLPHRDWIWRNCWGTNFCNHYAIEFQLYASKLLPHNWQWGRWGNLPSHCTPETEYGIGNTLLSFFLLAYFMWLAQCTWKQQLLRHFWQSIFSEQQCLMYCVSSVMTIGFLKPYTIYYVVCMCVSFHNRK